MHDSPFSMNEGSCMLGNIGAMMYFRSNTTGFGGGFAGTTKGGRRSEGSG